MSKRIFLIFLLIICLLSIEMFEICFYIYKSNIVNKTKLKQQEISSLCSKHRCYCCLTAVTLDFRLKWKYMYLSRKIEYYFTRMIPVILCDTRIIP